MKEKKSPPKKIHSSIGRNRFGNYVHFWKEVSDGKRFGKTFKTLEEAEEDQLLTRRRLAKQIEDGGYETTESRTRLYIAIESKLNEEKKSGKKTGPISKIAQDKSGLPQCSATKAKIIVRAMDDYLKKGEHEKAESLKLSLLCSTVAKTFDKLPDQYKGDIKVGSVDRKIRMRITGLARSLDEKCSKDGGAKKRDTCIKLLKKLSEKFEDWRASE